MQKHLRRRSGVLEEIAEQCRCEAIAEKRRNRCKRQVVLAGEEEPNSKNQIPRSRWSWNLVLGSWDLLWSGAPNAKSRPALPNQRSRCRRESETWGNSIEETRAR